MSLIFDRFPTPQKAEQFAESVMKKFNRRTTVCDTQDERAYVYSSKNGVPYEISAEFGGRLVVKEDEHENEDGRWDVFPCRLQLPAVLVERYPSSGSEDDIEYYNRQDEICEFVEQFGGNFAGT